MNNMLDTVTPKSDQLNYDDLIGGQVRTIKITNVSIATGDQPASLSYEGDNGKPYKPCKSMRRVLIHVWGTDGKKYIGRAMSLYGDPNVMFAGVKVGGIRISHMSDMKDPVSLALTVTKGSRKAFTVQPLVGEVQATSLQDTISDISHAPTLEGMEFKYKEAYKRFPDDESRKKIISAKDKRKAELTINKEIP